MRIRKGHGKPGKQHNPRMSFSRPGKSWNLSMGYGKLWKMAKNDFSGNNKARIPRTNDHFHVFLKITYPF